MTYELMVIIPTRFLLYLDRKHTMALVGCVTTLSLHMHLLLRATSFSIRQTLSLLQIITTHSLMMKSASVS